MINIAINPIQGKAPFLKIGIDFLDEWLSVENEPFLPIMLVIGVALLIRSLKLMLKMVELSCVIEYNSFVLLLGG